MTALSLTFLVVCFFGAFAYGSSSVMALRQASPVWTLTRASAGPSRMKLDRVSLAMFSLCTVWFVVNALAEFRLLAGGVPRSGYVDLVVLALSYCFPPVSMHVVWRETHREDQAPPPGAWRSAIAVMYIASPLVGLTVIAAIFELMVLPGPLGAYIGG